MFYSFLFECEIYTAVLKQSGVILINDATCLATVLYIKT